MPWERGFVKAVLGVEVDPAYRLIIGILLGYPFALLWRFVLRPLPSPVKHTLSFASGMGLAVWCYGPGSLHSLANIAAQYFLCLAMPRTGTLAVASWVLNMGWLLVSYWYVSTDSYDIDFTTAHCVLTLRLIGFAHDYVDGAAASGPSKNYLEMDEKKRNPIPQLPSPVAFLGFFYNWSGFLVGPQYSFNRYRGFVDGTLTPASVSVPWGRAAWLFAVGAVYIGVSAAAQPLIPVRSIAEPEFVDAYPYLLQRLGYMWVSIVVAMRTYAGVWCLTEGHCVISGLGFNGIVETSKGEMEEQWDGVANFLPARFETAACIPDIVLSFNINTNAWVKEYCFKRLRFLGNKKASMLGSLIFLAVWHGFAFGYFACFFMEFVDQNAEPTLSRIAQPIKRVAPPVVWQLLCCATAQLTLAAGFLPFTMKTLPLCIAAHRNLNWITITLPPTILALGAVLPRRGAAKNTKSE